MRPLPTPKPCGIIRKNPNLAKWALRKENWKFKKGRAIEIGET